MHSFLYNMMLYYGIIEFQASSSFTMFYSFTVFRCCMASPVWTYPQWPFLKVGILTNHRVECKILRPKSNLVIGCHTHSFKRNMPKLRCQRLGSCYSRAQTPSPSQDFPARRARRVGRKTPGVSRSIFGPFWSHVRPGRARLVSYSTKPGKLLITILMVQIIWAPRNQRN